MVTLKVKSAAIILLGAALLCVILDLLFSNEVPSVFFLIFLAPIILLLSCTSSYWLILFMGPRPFKTISRETKIVTKLSNRFGVKITRAFLSPLYPSSIFLIQSFWGSPQLIIGTSIASELSEAELEKLFENLILEIKSNRPHIGTTLTTYVFLFTLPLFVLDFILGQFLRNRTLRTNFIKFLGFPPFFLAKILSRETSDGKDLSAILPKLKKLQAKAPNTGESFLEEVFSFCRVGKVAGPV